MHYKFPAMKGMQANNEYYVCMISLGLLSRIFTDEAIDTLPEFRAQRKLKETRIPEIRDYILNNRDSYVFSALAASVNGTMKFVPSLNPDIGELEIDMNADFLINDGQHRKAAILNAIEHDDGLKDETIAVVLYSDKGLARSQQMFTDLNKHAVNTSKSLNTLYDSKDPIAIITKQVVDQIPFFRKYTDKEKDILGKFSSKLFTLNMLYDANKRILKTSIVSDKEQEFLIAFWNSIANNMREWQEMDNGDLSKRDLRESYISTQGVTIHAFGRLGHYLFLNNCYQIEQTLSGLQRVDWTRDNHKCWKERAITTSGRINRNEKGIFLTYIQIKRLLGINIEPDELTKEKKEL